MANAVDAYLAKIIRGLVDVWPADWHEEGQMLVWDRICFHGIASLVAEQISHGADWPGELKRKVIEEAQLQAFWEETHRNLLKKVFARLGRCEVDALVMKGTALAYSLYEEPCWRRRGDTDLLVNKTDLSVTREVLQAIGMVPRMDPQGLIFQETWLFDTGIGIIHPIDLHWQPNDSPVVQKVLRIDEVFAGSSSLPRLAPEAAAPPLPLTFIQCSINQAWHAMHGYLVDGIAQTGDGRLIWAWDNHLMARAFSQQDWERLVDISIDRGVAPIVLQALNLAAKGCDTDLPADVLSQLREAKGDPVIMQRMRESDQVELVKLDLRALTSPKAKIAFLLGQAFPNRRHLELKYPEQSSWPTLILHARRLGEAALRWLRPDKSR